MGVQSISYDKTVPATIQSFSAELWAELAEKFFAFGPAVSMPWLQPTTEVHPDRLPMIITIRISNKVIASCAPGHDCEMEG